jgi:hypothetical protein
VGNVAGTEVVFQGHPVDLKPLARQRGPARTQVIAST